MNTLGRRYDICHNNGTPYSQIFPPSHDKMNSFSTSTWADHSHPYNNLTLLCDAENSSSEHEALLSILLSLATIRVKCRATKCWLLPAQSQLGEFTHQMHSRTGAA